MPKNFRRLFVSVSFFLSTISYVVALHYLCFRWSNKIHSAGWRNDNEKMRAVRIDKFTCHIVRWKFQRCTLILVARGRTEVLFILLS